MDKDTICDHQWVTVISSDTSETWCCAACNDYRFSSSAKSMAMPSVERKPEHECEYGERLLRLLSNFASDMEKRWGDFKAGLNEPGLPVSDSDENRKDVG